MIKLASRSPEVRYICYRTLTRFIYSRDQTRSPVHAPLTPETRRTGKVFEIEESDFFVFLLLRKHKNGHQVIKWRIKRKRRIKSDQLTFRGVFFLHSSICVCVYVFVSVFFNVRVCSVTESDASEEFRRHRITLKIRPLARKVGIRLSHTKRENG